MNISVSGAGKKFNRDWIFRSFNYEFLSGEKYVILGSNGSGKSTLLQCLSGYQYLTEGALTFTSASQPIPVENIYTQIGLSAPYLELIEEFSLREMLDFHQKFKPFTASINTGEAIEIIGLQTSSEKSLKNFSSGMKQRVKLFLALASENSFVLLDEPSANLDSKSIQWYQDLYSRFGEDKTIIVCSNHLEQEHFFCKHSLLMEDLKGGK